MNQRDEFRTMFDQVKKTLTAAAADLDDYLDSRVSQMRERMGREGAPQIVPYIGMAGPDEIRVLGRVLTNPPSKPDFDRDRLMENLLNSYRRFASDEVPDVPVTIDIGDTSVTVTTDKEGYFDHILPRPENWGDDSFFSSVDLSVAVGDDQSVTTARGELLTPPSDAKLGVISDVDDTIMRTGATELTTMAKLTFFGNARTRAPLAGVSKLYSMLQTDGTPEAIPRNPVFYVSSSPWNLFDLLIDFLDLSDIPRGPVLLRDLGIDHDKFIKGSHDHKLEKIRSIMRLYPEMSFLLFGDSGQEDARIYVEAAKEFAGRIKAIFIRDINPQESSGQDRRTREYIEIAKSIDVPMFLVDDSVQAADRLIDLGCLPTSARESIVRETDKDRRRTQSAMHP